MENNKLLSVVIATKDREYYCIEVIKTILEFNDGRIEICVSDNSGTRQVKEFVDTLNHKDIKYRYSDDPISSIDNFNYAMELATGEYIILLGDDDTLLPESMETLEWAKKNKVDTFCSKHTHTYFWPGAHPDFHDGGLITTKSGNKFLKVDAKKNLIALLKNGVVNYFDFNLPKSYHGFVRRELMEEVKNQTGNFYGALSPDIFSVVALSLLSKSHYVFDQVFTIAGVCKKSTTANQIDGTHCGPLEQMPHLKNRKTEYNWDPLVPRLYSVSTIWSDSGLHSLRSMGESHLLKYFNQYPLISQVILMNRKYIYNLSINEAEKLRNAQKINKFYFWFRVCISSIKLAIRKIITVGIKKVQRANTIYRDVKDIKMAIKLLK